MQVGKDVHISCKCQPLVPKSIHPRGIPRMFSLTRFCDLVDLLVRPVGEGLLQFRLRAIVVQVVDGLVLASKRDEAARRNLVAQPPWNKAHQRRAWRTSIASVLQKILFEFKEIEFKEIQQFMLAL